VLCRSLGLSSKIPGWCLSSPMIGAPFAGHSIFTNMDFSIVNSIFSSSYEQNN
jgi:hypothetical protein